MKSAIRFVKFSIFLFLILCSIVIETKTYAEIGDTCTIMAPGFDTCASSGEVCVAPYGSEQGYCDTSCGNNQCEQNEGENYSNCPDDCECGNGVCDYGEWGSCSQDCFCNDDNTCDSLQGENQARCGIDECGCNNNDICENNRGETIYNCADCAVEGDGYCSSGESPTSPDCAQILCGNGQIDSGEVCDTSGNLGCGYNQGCFGCQVCEPIPVCGNGIIETQLYEQCDTASTLPNKGCNAGNTCVSLNGFPSGTAFCQCQPNTPVPPGDSSTCEISLTDCGMDCYSNNKPFDVFFVMDRSYSMVLGAKLNIMKTSFNSIIDALPTGSRASLITFNHAATLRNTLTTNLSSVRSWNPVNQNSVDYPEENSLTNYVDAFAKLTQEVNTHKSSFSGRNQLVYFFSDGEPTIGGPFVTQGPTHNGGNCTFGVINGQIVRTCSIGCNIPNDGCQYESATAAADAFHSTFSGLQTIAIGLDISQQHHYILANHVATPGLFSAIDSSVGISQIPKTPCYPYMQGYPNCTKPGPWTTDAFCASITQPINPLNKFVDQFCEMTCEPALCKVYTGNFAQQPAYNTPTGCIGGTYTDLPDAPNQWNWQCTGTDGTSHTCAAGQEPIGPMCHELTVVNLTGTTYEFTCSGTGTNYTIAITDQQGQPITTLQGPTATYTFQTGGTFTATCFIDGVTGLICPNNPTNPTNPTNPSNSGTPSHGSNTTNTSHQTSPGNTLLNNTLINNPTTTKGGTIQQPIVNKNAYNNAIVQNTVQQIITSVNSNEVNEVRPNNIVVLPPPPPIISTATPCYNPCQKTITVVMPEPEIFDLALRKTLPDSVAGYAPGGFVTFDIEVINQGNVPAQGIIISDYVPVGLTLQDPTWSYDANTRRAKKGYDSVLNPGETALFTITFKIDANASGKLINRAEITTDNGVDIDSTPDNDQANDCFGGDNVVTGDGSGTPNTPKCNPETDEDDHDPAELQIQVPTNPVYDLRIRKDVAAGPYTVGQTIQYTITIYNTGNITVSGLVTDILPVGLSYTGGSTYSFAPTQGGATITALGGGQRKVNNIAPGQYITMQYNVIIGTNATGTLKNNVKIIPDPLLPPELVPDNPGECIDDKNPLLSDSATNINNAVSGTNNRDCEEIQVQPAPKYDLRINKEVTSSGPYSIGSNVTYKITIMNTGNVIASGTVKDILPVGLSYTGSAVVSNPNVVKNTTILGEWKIVNMPANSTATITYTVIIGANATGTLKNNVKIIPDPLLPPELVPDNPGECIDDKNPLLSDSATNINNAVSGTNNRDCEEIQVQPAPKYDLRIKKDVSAGPYQPGQTVTYTLSVLNTGNIIASGKVTDILPIGLQYTGVATYSPSGYITQIGTGSWQVSNLEPGKIVTITYKVIIGQNSIGKLKNNVKIVPNPELQNEEIPDKEGICEIGNDPLINDFAVPDTNNRDCEEITVQPVPSYDLRIKKDVSAGPYASGQLITYTVTVLNTGTLAASGKVIDTLPVGLTYTGSQILSSSKITNAGTGMWMITNLLPNEQVTISYKVIIGALSGPKKNIVSVFPEGNSTPEIIPYLTGACEIGHNPLINDFAVPKTNNTDCEEIIITESMSCVASAQPNDTTVKSKNHTMTVQCDIKNMTGTVSVDCGNGTTGSMVTKTSAECKYTEYGSYVATCMVDAKKITGCNRPITLVKGGGGDPSSICISMIPSKPKNIYYTRKHDADIKCDVNNYASSDIAIDCGNGTKKPGFEGTCEYRNYGSYTIQCLAKGKPVNKCATSLTLEGNNGGGPNCGDGKKDKGEQCDDGSKNGTPTSLCSKTCSLKVIDPDPSDTPVCAFVDPPSIQMGEYVPFWWDLEDELETIQGNNCTEKTVGAVRLDTMVCDFTVLAPGGKTYSYTKKCNEDNLKSVKWYNDLQKDLKTKIMPRWGQSVLNSSEWKESGYGEYAIALEKITYDVCDQITSDTNTGKVSYEMTTKTYAGRVCQFNFAITAPYMMQKGSVLSSLEDDRDVLQSFHSLDGKSILDRRGERINFLTKTANPNTFEQVKKFAYEALDQVVSVVDATHPLALIAPVVKKSPREEIYLVEGNVNFSHTSVIGLNRGKATTIIVKGPYTVTINGGLPANLLLIVPEGKVVFNNLDCDNNDLIEGILLAKDFQTTATRKILTNTDLRAKERCQGGQLIVKGLIISENADAFATVRSQRRSTLARRFDGTKTKEEHIYGGASLRIDANTHQWDKLPPLARQTSMVFKLQGAEFGLSIPVYLDGSLLPFYLQVMIAAGEVSELE